MHTRVFETAAFFFFFSQEDAQPHKHRGDVQQVSEVENQFRLSGHRERKQKKKEKKKTGALTQA